MWMGAVGGVAVSLSLSGGPSSTDLALATIIFGRLPMVMFFADHSECVTRKDVIGR